jgi:hypothetical protein
MIEFFHGAVAELCCRSLCAGPKGGDAAGRDPCSSQPPARLLKHEPSTMAQPIFLRYFMLQASTLVFL